MDEDAIPEKFFEELTRYINPEQLIRDHDSIQSAEKNTLGIKTYVGAILRPISTQDIQKATELAQKYQVSLYPISTGYNWGLGSAMPKSKNSLLINLSSMNKVLEFDDKTGIVTIQPGVTQGMLRAFLDDKNAAFMSSITGAGPHTSIIGNLLDKGVGITGSAIHSIRAIECVLPDGTVYNDGKNILCKETLSPAIRIGLGPLLDGLFIQSDFAIVTAMTIALAHQPSFVSTVYIRAKSEEALAKTLDIYHAYNAIHGHGNFCSGRWSKNLFAQSNDDEYSYSFIIASSDRALHQARKKALKRIVRNTGLSMMTIDDKHIRFIRKIFSYKIVRKYFTKFSRLVDLLDISISYPKGYPNEHSLKEQYELLQTDLPEDKPLELARDGVGFIWYIVLLPANARSLLAFKNLVYGVAKKHGIRDSRFHALPYKSDVLAGLARVLFDLNDPEACARAHAFYNDLLTEGLTKGFVPHRVPIHIMHTLVDTKNPYWAVIKKIKLALDPQNIIAPDKFWP